MFSEDRFVDVVGIENGHTYYLQIGNQNQVLNWCVPVYPTVAMYVYKLLIYLLWPELCLLIFLEMLISEINKVLQRLKKYECEILLDCV